MPNDHANVNKCLRIISFNKHYYNYYEYILRNKNVLMSDIKGKFKHERDLHRGIRWLQKNGFIFLTLTKEHTESITPVDPIIAFTAYFSRFLWNFVPDIKYAENLDSNIIIKISNFKKCCEYIAKKTSSHLPSHGINNGLLAIPDKNRLCNVLSNIILEARGKIRGITVQNWSPDIALVWESIKNRIERGVKYHRITDIGTLVSFGFRINKRDIDKIGINLKVVDVNKLDEKYFIIDEDKLLIFEPSYNLNKFELKGTLVQNVGIIKRYIHKFESLWHTGVNAPLILNFLEKYRSHMNNVMQTKYPLDRNIKNLYFGIFDWGIFFKREYIQCSDKEYNDCVNALLKNKLIKPITSDFYGFIPNIKKDILKWMSNASNIKPNEVWKLVNGR